MTKKEWGEWHKEIVRTALLEYADKRISAYSKIKLDALLSKDVLLFALKGVVTADEFVVQSFAALESSSEETVMGNTWQNISKGLAWPAVIDAGDIMAEREGALWVIEAKSQTNTLNSSSLAQTVRSLKARVDHYSRFHTPSRRSVRAMIGVLRGPRIDEEREYSVVPSRVEDQDIAGFRYRYVVGPAYWQWLTGYPSPMPLVGDVGEIGQRVRSARNAALLRLQAELQERLAVMSLPQDINGVLTLVYEYSQS